MSKSKPKKRPGRPISENPLKKRYFRTTDSLWKMIQNASGGNASQWIRETCRQAIKRKLK